MLDAIRFRQVTIIALNHSSLFADGTLNERQEDWGGFYLGGIRFSDFQ
jgi:hypothetical protein